MKLLKEIGVLVLRLVLFILFYYVIGVFAGAHIRSLLRNCNVWQLMLFISAYIIILAAIYYYLGKLFSKISKDGNIYFDCMFVLIVLAWEAVTTATSDIAIQMKNFLWELSFGWATPLYAVVNTIVGEDINHYKYIFVGLWIIISFFMFLGICQRYMTDVKRKKINSFVLTVLGIMFIAVNTPSIIKGLTPHMFNMQTYPKIDGATAAIPLAQILSQKLLGKDVIEAKEFVKFNTTHDAYVNLINKNADIIFAAEPSKEELNLAEQNGIKLKLTPIGTDAFIFIVNMENPIDGLTIDEIRDIYSGKVTNWKELGWHDEDIMAYQRPKNSGSQTLMENVVMKGLTMMDAPSEITPGGMDEMMDVIDYKNSTNAIGYSVYYYASEMYEKENIKFLAIDDIPCNKGTIKTKEYPFAGSLYAVTRENDETESTIKLLEFLVSSEGQKYVEIGGFVPIQDDIER